MHAEHVDELSKPGQRSPASRRPPRNGARTSFWSPMVGRRSEMENDSSTEAIPMGAMSGSFRRVLSAPVPDADEQSDSVDTLLMDSSRQKPQGRSCLNEKRKLRWVLTLLALCAVVFLLAGQCMLVMLRYNDVNEAPNSTLVVVTPDSTRFAEAEDNQNSQQDVVSGQDIDQKQATSTLPVTDNIEKKIVLFRSIGNDLILDLGFNKSLDTVKFILQNEQSFKGVQKRWLINRIVDSEHEEAFIKLLDDWQQTYLLLPFALQDYSEQPMEYEGYGRTDMIHSPYLQQLDDDVQRSVWDYVYRHKSSYTVNLNGGRNVMLSEGFARGGEWVMPWPADVYVTPQGWTDIARAVKKHGKASKYLHVPITSVTASAALLNGDVRPVANEMPQLIFHVDAAERYNEDIPYGRRASAEILWRLQLAGFWDQWKQGLGLWEKKTWSKSSDVPHRDAVPRAGWAVRLTSDQLEREEEPEATDRGAPSSTALQRMLNKLDMAAMSTPRGFAPRRLLAYNETVLADERERYHAGTDPPLTRLVDKLIGCADAALSHGPFSVVNKTELPPSRDKHDYYTPSPYFWPNPDTPDGLPYIRKDGERVPGTGLYDEESDKFDRSRLASMIGNTTCLALAWYFTANEQYAIRGGVNVRTWFLDPATAMQPNLRFAQIRWGHNNNTGANFGVIETKDFYYLLDAFLLLESSGVLRANETAQLKDWMTLFAQYLVNSQQGSNEYTQLNNHGTYYDVQLAAIASYVNDTGRFHRHTELSKSRIPAQFMGDGTLPREMVRPTSLHYVMFTLQGWTVLGRIAAASGIDLYDVHLSRYPTDDGSPALQRSFLYAIPYLNSTWSHVQNATEEMDRMLPLYYSAVLAYPDLIGQQPQADYVTIPSHYEVNPLFFTHFGIQPFWNLGLANPSALAASERQRRSSPCPIHQCRHRAVANDGDRPRGEGG